MLREFSPKRIVGFFLFDWLGSLAMLYLAGSLRLLIGSLPAPLTEALRTLEIQIGGAGGEAFKVGVVPAPVYLLVSLIWPFFFITLSIYDGRRSATLRTEMLNVFMAICISVVTLAGALYVSYRETPRLALALFVALDMAILEGGRVWLWLYRRVRNGKGKTKSRAVLVIGAGVVGQKVVQELHCYGWADFDLVGYLDDDPDKQGQVVAGLPVLGTLDQAVEIIQRQLVQHAVVALPLRAHERMVAICRTLQKMGVHVHVVPDLFVLSFPNTSLDGFGGIPVINLGQPGMCGWRLAAKRVFDVLLVSIGLALLWPLLALIAILIRLDSPGPIIYGQTRIGEYGRLLTMYKFRSMRAGSDPGLHQAHVTRLIRQNLTPEQLSGRKNGSLKLDSDPRITRVGRIIRKTSLDELPQLVNVLRGEMSLVGPRPPLPYEVDLYQDWHKRRLDVLPGITGPWQVKGRNRVSFDEMVRMDLEYIERQSLWLDIVILLQTPWALIHTRGAG